MLWKFLSAERFAASPGVLCCTVLVDYLSADWVVQFRLSGRGLERRRSYVPAVLEETEMNLEEPMSEKSAAYPRI
jgi:hypothetical protein